MNIRLPVIYDYDGYADGNPVYDIAYCPECDYEFDEGKAPWGEPYCPHCGQMLDWRRNEDGGS